MHWFCIASEDLRLDRCVFRWCSGETLLHVRNFYSHLKYVYVFKVNSNLLKNMWGWINDDRVFIRSHDLIYKLQMLHIWTCLSGFVTVRVLVLKKINIQQTSVLQSITLTVPYRWSLLLMINTYCPPLSILCFLFVSCVLFPVILFI